MSLGNFGKKLQRDLKANPKKGLLLLLMVCGAGYFWGPILKRWVGGKPGQPGAVAAASVILDDPKPVDTAGKFKPPSWEKLQEFLLKDGLTKSAVLPREVRDPFAIGELLQATPSESSSAQDQLPTTPTRNPLGTNANAAVGEAQELDLKVTSVVFGPRGRLASIGGKVVWEGDSFELDGKSAAEGKVTFVVRRVETWGVLLECAGQEFKAYLPQSKLKLKDRVGPEAVVKP